MQPIPQNENHVDVVSHEMKTGVYWNRAEEDGHRACAERLERKCPNNNALSVEAPGQIENLILLPPQDATTTELQPEKWWQAHEK